MKRVNEKLQPYECPECKKCFTTSGSLTRHKGEVHVTDRERLYKCEQCTDDFKTVELLRKHVRSVHTEDRPHMCLVCKYSFKTERGLRRHLGKTSGNAHECPECRLLVSDQRALQDHKCAMLEPLRMRPYQCEKCGKKFKRKFHVDRHRLCVHGKHKQKKSKSRVRKDGSAVHCDGNEELKSQDRDAVDGDTEQAVADESMVVETWFVEDEGNRYQVEVSNPTGSLPSKSRSVTSVAIQPFLPGLKCGDCEMVLKSAELLQNHQALVHGKGNFCQCDACGVRFLGQAALQEHRRSVHGQKPNQCPDCGKCFARKRNVRRHQLSVHGQKKVYQCNDCDKTFLQETHLFQHKELYKGNCKGGYPVQEVLSEEARDATAAAPVTDIVTRSMKSVVDKSSSEILSRHQAAAVHAKQKPNECPDCGMCFTRNYDMRRHRMCIHLKKKFYQCDICNKVFSRKEHVVSHKRIHNLSDCYSKEDPLSKQESLQQAHDETTQEAAPANETATRRMKSLVDVLGLATEINAGMADADVEVDEAVCCIQNSVSGSATDVQTSSLVEVQMDECEAGDSRSGNFSRNSTSLVQSESSIITSRKPTSNIESGKQTLQSMKLPYVRSRKANRIDNIALKLARTHENNS